MCVCVCATVNESGSMSRRAIQWSLICIQVRRRKKSNRTVSNGIHNEQRYSVSAHLFMHKYFHSGSCLFVVSHVFEIIFRRMLWHLFPHCILILHIKSFHVCSSMTMTTMTAAMSNVEHSIHTYALNYIWINFRWLNFGTAAIKLSEKGNHPDVWAGWRKEKKWRAKHNISHRIEKKIGNNKVKSVNWLDGDILSEQSNGTMVTQTERNAWMEKWQIIIIVVWEKKKKREREKKMNIKWPMKRFHLTWICRKTFFFMNAFIRLRS